MLQLYWNHRFSIPVRFVVTLALSAFLSVSVCPAASYGQVMRHSPSTSVMLMPSTHFSPMNFQGIRVFAENPLRFEFIADKGSSALTGEGLENESVLLVKYFLAALTIPEKDMWVNLSPYEKDIIIEDNFMRTHMGKVLLEQDYVLKQMTASLTYPESELGRQFWGRVYQSAHEKFGTTDIPINAFNKVWIVPKSADVADLGQGAVIVDSQLDVMVESDYLAIKQNASSVAHDDDQQKENQLYSSIIREVIIPELRKEVNEGKYFAPLRQVYHAMILATWYKRHLKQGLLDRIYVRQNKIEGVANDEPQVKQRVYEQYVETFRKGIYNYIREDLDQTTHKVIPRKYVSGGMEFTLLGLGVDGDKYRELSPTAINTVRPIGEPLIVSSDLTLLTPDGKFASLPVEKTGKPKQTDQVTNPASLLHRWLRKIVPSILFVSVLGVGALYPSNAYGAKFDRNSSGDLVVRVERGDTFGGIVQRMRSTYRAVDPQAYRTSSLSGELWGPRGVVSRLAEGRDVDEIFPDSEFVFVKGQIPEQVMGILSPSITVRPPSPFVSIPTVDRGEATIVTEEETDRESVPTEIVDLGVKSSPIDLLLALGGLTLWWGLRKALSFRSKKKLNREEEGGGLKTSAPVSAGDGMHFVSQEDELPRLDDLETPHTDAGNEDGSIFVTDEGLVASPQEEALWRQELAMPSPAQASVETFPSLRTMDFLGTTAGVLLAGLTTDWNYLAVGSSVLFMPFVTRITFALQLYAHEAIGHLLPALALSAQRTKIFTAANLKANYGLNDWANVLIPGVKPSAGKNPFVETLAQGVRKKIIELSGFLVSFAGGLLAVWGGFHVWLPLAGPIAVASWKVLAGSYATDVKGRAIAEGIAADACGNAQCGIFGALWSDDSREIYPQWLRDGFTKLINALIIRGGQSAGEFAIGFRSSAQANSGADAEMVPILSKVLKYKRGQGLTETLDEEFGRLVDRFGKQKVGAVPGVKGVLGHVRFATGGKVTREASHPHMGIEEEHKIWILENGSWVNKSVNVFAAIGHNGDNDGWQMWGHEFNTAQIREIFPAIFRMPKTYRVVVKQKDPVTGREVRETKYEALPPGDSPPLALQLHYLLTQGDWISSARYAYIDRLLGRSEGAERSGVQQLLDRALGRLLTSDQETFLAQTFESVFQKHAPALLRPRLNKSDKSFNDLWVTEDVAKRFESLRYQLDAINAFRDDLRLTFVEAVRSGSELGRILEQAGPIDQQGIEVFVDTAVEMFFTGSRSAAVEQFARRSTGSYGLAVRTSKEPNGVTLYSADQGVTIGYNQSSRLVTFSSEHSTLQYAFGEKGKMDHLVFINPEQPGQMADVNLKPGVSQASPISIKVYSFALNRVMTAQEIAEQQFPQDPANPYWSPQISYQDPNEIVMTDINAIPKEVLAARQSWEKADSFNRQTADSLVEKLTARHLEQFIKQTSEFYGTIQANLMVRIFARARECLTGGGCDAKEANRRSAQISDRLQADGRIGDFVRSRLDWVVGQVSQDLAKQVVRGKMDETDISIWVRMHADTKLKELLDKEIDDVVNAVLAGDIRTMSSFRTWDSDQREGSDENASAGLNELARSTADLVSGQAATIPSSHEAHSLVAGETDMIIAGYEDSLWLGENFVEMMRTVFPRMKIWATSSNKVFNLNGDHIVGRSTIGMIISKSGATYPSRGIVRRLKQISQGNVFAMTSRIDNLIAMSLGQKFKPDSPFIKRIFVTGNYYPAEANSVGEVMLFAHQIELMIYLAERMLQLFPDQRPWGMVLTAGDLAQLRHLRDQMYEEASRLTAHDQLGQVLDASKIRQHVIERLENGYLKEYLANRLTEQRRQSPGVTPAAIAQILRDVVDYDGPGSDPGIQSILEGLLAQSPVGSDQQQVSSIFSRLTNTAGKIDEQSFRAFFVGLLQKADARQLKMMERVYLSANRSIVDNGHAIGKTMAESMIVNNIVFRIFVMSIFWFGAPLENLLSLAGIHFGGVWQDGLGFLVKSLDGVLALCAPWLMTTLVYRLWSGRPQWARLGPPTVVLGDPIPALHQTGENYWSKLGAVSLGSMSMDIHGANPEDHFVARLAHRVVRGTIAVFGVPAEPVGKENVIVSMRQTKAIINGMFMNFFKGGAEVFSVGRGGLSNPDVTDHHMDIGVQDLDGASPAVLKINGLAFDAFGRHIAYKVLFANAYQWATRWEPRITLFGKTLSLKKFYLWNPAWTYSRTGVHTTRSPKGGPTAELPEYLDPSDGKTREISRQLLQQGFGDVSPAQAGVSVLKADRSAEPVVSSSSAKTLTAADISFTEESRRGGIDLNAKWLDLRVTETGRTDLFLDGKSLDAISIKGIIPRIIDIRPVSMSRVFSMWGQSGYADSSGFFQQQAEHSSTVVPETLAVCRKDDLEGVVVPAV